MPSAGGRTLRPRAGDGLPEAKREARLPQCPLRTICITRSDHASASIPVDF
jgi:hypothetical protein